MDLYKLLDTTPWIDRREGETAHGCRLEQLPLTVPKNFCPRFGEAIENNSKDIVPITSERILCVKVPNQLGTIEAVDIPDVSKPAYLCPSALYPSPVIRTLRQRANSNEFVPWGRMVNADVPDLRRYFAAFVEPNAS